MVEEETGSLLESIVSRKQQKMLTRIVRDLCAYFGVYYLSQELDKLF